ncbi:MAG TPA: response regulator [Tepidisphaeraceae bacterium]|nr:response regulator [Tepidisphaeraceae bacterium]
MTALNADAQTLYDFQSVPILVVDDNAVVAAALARILENAGFNPTICHRGVDALEHVRAHPCAAALVDIHLPDLNGLVVAQKLREMLGPTTPIVIVSGDTSMEVINALPHVGATYFFSKPLNANDLLERMREWLAKAD